MKKIIDINLPINLKYSENHVWVNQKNDVVSIGISDYAQDQLGEIIFVELPGIGDSFEKGDEFGSIESLKAVSEIYTPISGEVVEVNEALENTPELVNNSCYERGWLIKLRPFDASEINELMDKAAYRYMLKE